MRGLFGTLAGTLRDVGAGIIGVETQGQKDRRRARSRAAQRNKDLFGQNIAASEAAEKSMREREAAMQSKMAAAPGAAQRDVAEAAALGMGRANIGGPGSIAAFRQAGIKGHDALARGEADLATANLAMERGRQTDETQNMIEVNNALNAARQAGALDQNAIARISGMARSKAARDLVQNAMANYKAPKKASLTGDVGNILGYLTT